MTTVLQYLVVAAVVALVLFGIALLLFGRGEQLSALPARTSPAVLPEQEVSGQDVREVRFALALRGYRMADVDWTLERLAEELDRLRSQLAATAGAAQSAGNDASATEAADPDAPATDSDQADTSSDAGPDTASADTRASDTGSAYTRPSDAVESVPAPSVSGSSNVAPTVGVLSRPGGLFANDPAPESPR